MDLHKNTEVSYWSGSFAEQLRPEYFWVLVQELEHDETPIT
jgi:hypothetical protein